MAYVTQLINNLASGEVSPRLFGRPEHPVYQTGARTMQNFIPTLNGGVRKRPGTRYIDATAGNARTRLFDLALPDGTAYLVELTAYSVRVRNASTGVLETMTAGATPYAEADLADIHVAAAGGVLYLVHRLYPVQMLSKSAGAWTVATVIFTGTRTFAATGDYPSLITFAYGRMWLGATDNEPSAVFASKAPDGTATPPERYTNFTFVTPGGTNPSDGIFLLENDAAGTRLQWLAFHQVVLACSQRAFWQADGNIPTPATFDMALASGTGSSHVQPVSASGAILFAGRAPNQLMAAAYTQEGGGMQATPLNQMADHILEGGFSELAMLSYPEPIALIVRTDGQLVVCAFHPEVGAIGFSRMVLGGGGIVESVAVAKGPDYDRVFVSARFGAQRFILAMEPPAIANETLATGFYLDAGLDLSPASATVTGLSHLEGMAVDAIGDGCILPRKTVSGGSVSYDRTIAHIHIGLPYLSVVETLTAELPANGTSQGKKRRAERVVVRLHESYGGRVGRGADNLDALLYETWGAYVLGAPPTIFSGDIPVTLAGLVDTVGLVRIEHEEPTPFNILALMTTYGLQEA